MTKGKIEQTSPLVNLPPELLEQIFSYVLGTNKKRWLEHIIDKKTVSPIDKKAGAPSSLANKNFYALSQTCAAFRAYLKPERCEHQARQLLLYALEGNEIQTISLASLNPELLFTKVTSKVREYAAGLVEETNEDGRVVLKSVPQEYCNITPLRALMVVEDGEMLNKLLPIIKIYFDTCTQKNGIELAQEQWQAQFPSGVGDPPTNPFDFSELVNSITADQNLRYRGVASQTTQDALKKFRMHFRPRLITEENSHHHSNISELIRALKVYDDNWDHWHGSRLDHYFWCRIIGGFQRLLSTIDAQWLCRKHLHIVLKEKEGCARELKIGNWITKQEENLFPLDSNLDCRLGIDFGVLNCGIAQGLVGCAGIPHTRPARKLAYSLQKYVEQKNQTLTTFRNTLNSEAIVQRVDKRMIGSA